MDILIVVDTPRDWPLAIPGVQRVTARAYLTDPLYGADRSFRVFNLCRSYRYQSLGYYVSLLAEARGHKPLPRVGTIEDLQSQTLVRHLTGVWMCRSSRFWLLSGRMNSNSASISAAAWTAALTTSACIFSICCRRRYCARTLNAGMANGICAASGRLPAVIFRLTTRNLQCRQQPPISWGAGSERGSVPFRALILPSCTTLPTQSRLPISRRCRNLQRPPGNWE